MLNTDVCQWLPWNRARFKGGPFNSRTHSPHYCIMDPFKEILFPSYAPRLLGKIKYPSALGRTLKSTVCFKLIVNSGNMVWGVFCKNRLRWNHSTSLPWSPCMAETPLSGLHSMLSRSLTQLWTHFITIFCPLVCPSLVCEFLKESSRVVLRANIY